VEAKKGKDAVLKIINEGFEGTMTFFHYPLEASYYSELREKAAALIRQ
jgi:hypothetical protein